MEWLCCVLIEGAVSVFVLRDWGKLRKLLFKLFHLRS